MAKASSLRPRQAPVTSPVESPAKAASPDTERLGVPVKTVNGVEVIDFESMRSANRSRVIAAFQASAITPGATSSAIDPEWLAVSLQLSTLTGVIAAQIVEKLGYGREQSLSFLLQDTEATAIATP